MIFLTFFLPSSDVKFRLYPSLKRFKCQTLFSLLITVFSYSHLWPPVFVSTIFDCFDYHFINDFHSTSIEGMELVYKINPEDYFHAQVTSMSHIGNTIELIKMKLTEQQLNMFRRTSFGPLLDVEIMFNGQLIHHMLLRQVEDDRDDIISFNVRGKNVSFSIDDFNIITGLWPSRKEVTRKTSCRRLQELVFGRPTVEVEENEAKVSAKEFETSFERIEFANDEDAVKIALALFIELAMMGKDKKTLVDMSILGIVDDWEVFKHYNWSSLIFERTLGSLKKVMKGRAEEARREKDRPSSKRSSAKKTQAYNIKGFAHAFQVWAYELLFTSRDGIAIKLNETAIPRMLRWRCTRPPSYVYLEREVFNLSLTKIASGLVMTEAELRYKKERRNTIDISPQPAVVPPEVLSTEGPVTQHKHVLDTSFRDLTVVPREVASTSRHITQHEHDSGMHGDPGFSALEIEDDLNTSFQDGHEDHNDDFFGGEIYRSKGRNDAPSAIREKDRLDYLTECVGRIGQRVEIESKSIRECVGRIDQRLEIELKMIREYLTCLCQGLGLGADIPMTLRVSRVDPDGPIKPPSEGDVHEDRPIGTTTDGYVNVVRPTDPPIDGDVIRPTNLSGDQVMTATDGDVDEDGHTEMSTEVKATDVSPTETVANGNVGEVQPSESPTHGDATSDLSGDQVMTATDGVVDEVGPTEMSTEVDTTSVPPTETAADGEVREVRPTKLPTHGDATSVLPSDLSCDQVMTTTDGDVDEVGPTEMFTEEDATSVLPPDPPTHGVATSVPPSDLSGDQVMTATDGDLDEVGPTEMSSEVEATGVPPTKTVLLSSIVEVGPIEPVTDGEVVEVGPIDPTTDGEVVDIGTTVPTTEGDSTDVNEVRPTEPPTDGDVHEVRPPDPSGDQPSNVHRDVAGAQTLIPDVVQAVVEVQPQTVQSQEKLKPTARGRHKRTKLSWFTSEDANKKVKVEDNELDPLPRFTPEGVGKKVEVEDNKLDPPLVVMQKTYDPLFEGSLSGTAHD